MSALCVIPGGLLASESSSVGEWTYCKMEVDGHDDRCDACAHLNDNHMPDCKYVFCFVKESKVQVQPEPHG